MEAAFRAALREELASPLVPLTESVQGLAQAAAALTALVEAMGLGREAPAHAHQTGPESASERGLPGRPAGATGAVPLDAPAPARGCAVLGCARPHRSLGFCGTHYQRRRILSSLGRLPPSWVEEAAPGTLADVLLPRGPRERGEREVPAGAPEAPAGEAKPGETARVWVRRQGQRMVPLGADPAALEAAEPRGEEGAQAGAQPPDGTRPQDEAVEVAANLEEWAQAFRAERRGA